MSDVRVPRRLRAFVSVETLDAIEAAVRRAESGTTGEIVVHIVGNLLPFETSRKRARRAFAELGVERTTYRNGVLLLAVMKKRRFEIIADEGIDAKVSPAPWQEIANLVSGRIQRDGFTEGMCAGVEQIGRVLATHFPSGGSDPNTLTDRPLVDPE